MWDILGWPTECIIRRGTRCCAQSLAFRSSGRADISLSRSISGPRICSTTSGLQVFTERREGEICSQSMAFVSSRTRTQLSRKDLRRRTSSSTEMASRLVRADSAPISIMSAPSLICCLACSRAFFGSREPSPENESSFMLTIPIRRGRRGNEILRVGVSRIMARLKPDRCPST